MEVYDFLQFVLIFARCDYMMNCNVKLQSLVN